MTWFEVFTIAMTVAVGAGLSAFLAGRAVEAFLVPRMRRRERARAGYIDWDNGPNPFERMDP